MRAMLLAAGLGTRLRPLTTTCPKPLIPVDGKPLIEYHLEALSSLGVSEVWINTHWLPEQFEPALGQGDRWSLRIQYCYEPMLLDTAGGIINMMKRGQFPDSEPFWVVSSDVYFDMAGESNAIWLDVLAGSNACVGLVDNPPHHPNGDFGFDVLSQQLSLASQAHATLTYSGIGLYRPQFFEGLKEGPARLGDQLKNQIKRSEVKGIKLSGYWQDVGTVDRLNELEHYLQA